MGGHKAAPLGGEVWAHAFVVCAGCEEVVNKLATACFELDLREWSEELVFAWWRYLYTQDDLLLLWPCAGRTREESAAGEAFWRKCGVVARASPAHGLVGRNFERGARLLSECHGHLGHPCDPLAQLEGLTPWRLMLLNLLNPVI